MTIPRLRGCQRQGVSHEPRGIRLRYGVTLLELIVVIAMLGLILAIAAPAFIVPSADDRRDLASVLAAARRTAVLRGEPVTLNVGDAGEWMLMSDASTTAPAIATGTLDPPLGRIRVRVSPLGSCIPESSAGDAAKDWSAVGCGPPARAEVPHP
jgi:prepilin-type N-terminal cleavage/methylation domain-containing protein